MMWPLARDTRAFAGCPIPGYPRHRTPIRIIPPDDGRPVS